MAPKDCSQWFMYFSKETVSPLNSCFLNRKHWQSLKLFSVFYCDGGRCSGPRNVTKCLGAIPFQNASGS